jgi:ferritin
MINETMTSELNTQLNREFYSAYLYLAMSTWCENSGYKGSSSWFMVQHEEERMHAFKIYHYLLGQGTETKLLTIKQPEINYSSLLECFEDSLHHERLMTDSFNELCDLAIKQKDHASYTFFQWFVQEQIEEEASVNEIISKLKLVGDGNGIFLIDNQLAERKLNNLGNNSADKTL